MRFGVLHASQMLMMWRRYTGLGDTQLSGTKELTDIRLAVARSIPFVQTPLFGLAGLGRDTASREIED